MTAQIGFICLSIALVLYFLFSARKEVPMLLLCHALIQYGLTMVLWFFQLADGLAFILMVFTWLSSLMLIWGRSLGYGRDLFSIRLFFSVSQWAILLVLVLFISLKSPFYYVFPTAEFKSPIPIQRLSFHPILKLSGNILVFTSFFHVILHWGQRWKWVKSLIDLLPLLIYIGMLVALRYWKLEATGQPFS